MIVYTIPLNNHSLKPHFFKRQIRILTYCMNNENFIMILELCTQEFMYYLTFTFIVEYFVIYSPVMKVRKK